MDKKLEEKMEILKKSMYKSIQKVKRKDAIEDVLDENRVAEMGADDVPTSKTNTLKKDIFTSKPIPKPTPTATATPPQSGTKGFGSMLGTPPKKGDKLKLNTSKFKFGKGEEFVLNVLEKFEVISKAYLMEKAKIDKEKFPEGSKGAAKNKKKARAERNKPHTDHHEPNTRSARDERNKGIDSKRKKGKDQVVLRNDLQDKHGKKPKKDDLEYPMASSEKTL